MSHGQSLVELAVCAPAILLLSLGTVATAQIVDAHAGLDSATQAAAAEAARSPTSSAAQLAAQARFTSIVAGYPLTGARLTITVGAFSRTGQVHAQATGGVDVSWAALLFPRSRLVLESTATVPIESWRSRGPAG